MVHRCGAASIDQAAGEAVNGGTRAMVRIQVERAAMQRGGGGINAQAKNARSRKRAYGEGGGRYAASAQSEGGDPTQVCGMRANPGGR